MPALSKKRGGRKSERHRERERERETRSSLPLSRLKQSVGHFLPGGFDRPLCPGEGGERERERERVKERKTEREGERKRDNKAEGKGRKESQA